MIYIILRGYEWRYAHIRIALVTFSFLRFVCRIILFHTKYFYPIILYLSFEVVYVKFLSMLNSFSVTPSMCRI